MVFPGIFLFHRFMSSKKIVLRKIFPFIYLLLHSEIKAKIRLEAVSEFNFENFVLKRDWTVLNMTTVRKYHK